MAIGLALMVGIWLPFNFNSPYKATSLIDFWRRWHMTLSRFLRDYLYIPLGGNRKGILRRHINLLVTMVLGGLWHGAAWNFIVWGGIHGCGLLVNHLWRHMTHKTGLRLPKLIGWACSFFVVVVAWVPFRAANMADTVYIWRAMFMPSGPAPYTINVMAEVALFWVLALLLIACLTPNTQQIFAADNAGATRWKPRPFWAIVMGIAFGISLGLLLAGGNTQFLYFKF